MRKRRILFARFVARMGEERLPQSAFAFSAQFVSLEALEVPYYVTLLGAATLSVYSRLQREPQETAEHEGDEDEYDYDEGYEDGYDEGHLSHDSWAPIAVG